MTTIIHLPYHLMAIPKPGTLNQLDCRIIPLLPIVTQQLGMSIDFHCQVTAALFRWKKTVLKDIHHLKTQLKQLCQTLSPSSVSNHQIHLLRQHIIDLTEWEAILVNILPELNLYSGFLRDYLHQMPDLASMRLSPNHPDPILTLTSLVTPSFSLSRDPHTPENFKSCLNQHLQVTRSLYDQLINKVADLVIARQPHLTLADPYYDREQTRSLIMNTSHELNHDFVQTMQHDLNLAAITLWGQSIDFSRVSDSYGSFPGVDFMRGMTLDAHFFTDIMLIGDRVTMQEYIQIIMSFAVLDDLDDNTLTKESRSLAVQYMLAEIGIQSQSLGIGHTNIGQVLDQNQALALDLIHTVNHANQNLEQAILNWVNLNHNPIGLSRPFSNFEQNVLIAVFRKRFNIIVEHHSHPDEFLTHIPKHEGRCICTTGAIATDLAGFLMYYADQPQCSLNLTGKQRDLLNTSSEAFTHFRHQYHFSSRAFNLPSDFLCWLGAAREPLLSYIQDQVLKDCIHRQFGSYLDQERRQILFGSDPYLETIVTDEPSTHSPAVPPHGYSHEHHQENSDHVDAHEYPATRPLVPLLPAYEGSSVVELCLFTSIRSLLESVSPCTIS